MLKIVAWPAGTKAKSNEYLSGLYGNVCAQDLSIVVREASAASLIRGGDILHIHWPEDFASLSNPRRAAARFFEVALVIVLWRLLGRNVVWTAHNAIPHESRYPLLRALMYRLLSVTCSAVIHLSESARVRFGELHGSKFSRCVHRVLPHGRYADGVALPQLRARADTEQVVFGAFGQVRKYKHYPDLISWVEEARDECILHVKGAPVDSDETSRIETMKMSRTLVDVGWLASEDLYSAIDDVDAVVIADPGVSNSGVALLALSRYRRIVVPAVAEMLELKSNVGLDWVYIYDKGSEEMICDAVAWVRSSSPSDPPNLTAYDWNYIADGHICLFRRMVSVR